MTQWLLPAIDASVPGRRAAPQRTPLQEPPHETRTRVLAPQLSPGIAEPSAAAICVGKGDAQNRSNPAAELAIRLPNLQTARPRQDVAAASYSKLTPQRPLDSCGEARAPSPAKAHIQAALCNTSMMFPNVCCVMGGDDFEEEGAPPVWPPAQPPLTTTHGRLTLVRGYLKRKSTRNLEDGGPPRWALRWLEVDPPEEDRPEYMLSVYKTAQKSKRLNAVSLKKISSVRHDDSLPCAFVVSVGESNYTLLARDAADCDAWVQSLNDAREALNEAPGAQCVAS